MARQKLKEYYTPDEISPELLRGAVDETTPRQRRILDFVQLRQHDNGLMRLKVYVQQVDRFASVVGFSDSSIRVQGLKTEEKVVSPFHIKNFYEFKATDEDGFVVPAGNGFAITREGIAYGVQTMEEYRQNLQVWALLAMLNDKQFTYADGDFKIVIPYTDEIGDLDDPTNPLDDGSAEPFKYIFTMKDAFYKLTKQKPNLVFMNATTGGKFTGVDEVKAAFVAQRSVDPDRADAMFESFTWNGIRWVILHEEYPDLDGTLKDAVADDRMLVTVDSVMGAGPESGRPFQINRARNVLNRDNAGRPHYDQFPISDDPWASGTRLYDNMIPTISKRNIVMHWNNVTT